VLNSVQSVIQADVVPLALVGLELHAHDGMRTGLYVVWCCMPMGNHCGWCVTEVTQPHAVTARRMGVCGRSCCLGFKSKLRASGYCG